MLREVVALPVDVIVTGGSAMALAARQATDTIPIVAIGPNLVALGLAKSLAQPGGNVTGLTFDAGPGILGKRLELLKRAMPAVKRVAYIRGPMPSGQPPWSAQTAEAARALGLVLSVLEVDSPEDLDAALVAMSRTTSQTRPDAIWCADTPVNIGNRDRIIAFAARARLPTLFGLRQFTDSGGLMSYGTNLAEAEARAAQYVDKILKGAKPGELPIEQPTRFEFVVNLKTAATLGIAMPKALLLAADEVIQ